MESTMRKYPIGTKVALERDDETDKPHEVVGYKKINGNKYLLFMDGQMALVERVTL